MISFKNTIVLITGGGSGIGLALAREFLREECAKVVICGRDEMKLGNAVEVLNKFVAESGCPGAVEAIACDVADEAQCRDLLRQVEQRHTRLDVLVNNAAIYGRHKFFEEDFDPAEAERMMQTNFIAPIRLAHMALPLLRRSHAPFVVNVSSGLAYAPLPRAPIYSASKSALHFFTSAIGKQKAEGSIRVIEVLPPIVDTAMAQHAKILKMPVERFARKTMKALKHGRREIRIGGTHLLYWAMRLCPSLALKVMDRF